MNQSDSSLILEAALLQCQNKFISVNYEIQLSGFWNPASSITWLCLDPLSFPKPQDVLTDNLKPISAPVFYLQVYYIARFLQ